MDVDEVVPDPKPKKKTKFFMVSFFVFFVINLNF